MRILVTGGAGFIGAHLTGELLRHGHEVRILDNLDPQIHGSDAATPSAPAAEAELIRGDVRSGADLDRALCGVDAVAHLAAKVGIAQSMYAVEAYADVNVRGTAALLEAVARRGVGRLVIASSMTVYGEGMFVDTGGRAVDGAERTPDRLAAGAWDPVDGDGRPLRAVPTPESKRPMPLSNYAVQKLTQERMGLLTAQVHGIAATALRLFSVYGPGQALSNPYTGVLANFAARLLNGRAPLIYEDGLQSRDFVHVADVARVFRLALERPGPGGSTINVGTGVATTVLDVAGHLSAAMDVSAAPTITGEHRAGDVRHCFADMRLAGDLLGFAPAIRLGDGLSDLATWLRGRTAVDRSDAARGELARRGLVR